MHDNYNFSSQTLYDGEGQSAVHLSQYGVGKGKKSWIATHFARRECIRFIEKPKKDGEKDSDPYCHCGRKKSRHTQSAKNADPSLTEWTTERCTKRLPTNAYGEIDFQGTGSQKRAPYVRVSHDTDASRMLELMLKRWDLEIPNLVISVTGGAKSFVLKPRLKEVFRRGLVKAAKTTGAWIITGGTNTGVMKHVGEAVKEQQLMLGVDTEVNVIGIASWGIVDKQKALIQAKGENGRYPATYSMEPSHGWNGAMLDSNHSHFILVDNGTQGKYGVEISLRSHIEEAIMKQRTDSRSKSGSIGVPVVLLVLEGGPNTVQTMYELIKKKVPAVVIDGSGRAANVVAFAYSHTIKKCIDGQTICVIDPAYEDQVKEKVSEVFGERSVESLYEKIKAVLEDEKMVSVYRLDDGTISQEIDLAILKALLKANRSSPLTQLNLALAWNRIDLAKSDIFTEDRLWTTEHLSGPMLTALLDDKADFAELFLGNGLSMSEFLTTEILCQLYAAVPANSTIKPLLQEEMNQRQAPAINMQLVGEVIENLMGDMYRSHYLRDGRYFTDLSSENDGGMSLKRMMSKSSIPVININQIDPIPTPYRDVFLWAVLCNRRELARVLWEAGREPVAAALMASKLLRSMAEKSHTDDTITDISKDLKEHAKLFEERATGVLDECFEENETLSQTLLVRELDNFGYLTCLDLAVSGDSQDFIAHTACQLLLTRLWMGAMAMNTTSLKVILCMFVPFLIFPIIYFVPDVHQERQEAAREHEKSLVNNKPTETVATYKSKKEENENYDEESMLGVEEEDEVFSIEEYIPEIRQDDSVEVMLRSKKLGVCQRIYSFYSSPFTKFVGNVISYVAFICLYAYVIMTNFPKFDSSKTLGGISPVEILLYFWVFSILLEEIRQLASKAPKHFFDKVSIYFSDPWNFIDILSIAAFVTAIILRFFPEDDIFNAARVILSLDIVIFIVRSLQIFSVNRHLGPRLVMIRKMMDDLKQFVIILLVFLVSYGISLEAVMFPGPGQYARNDTLKSILGVLELPYWQMYGELFLDEIKGEKPDDFGPVSPIGKTLSPFLLAAYMLFANVLLLNLLIAIFSYTFELIQEDSDKVWKFQRYDLVLEYHNRPMFSPPLILIGHLFVFIRWVWQLCRCGNPPPKGSSMKLKLTEMEIEQIDNWEFQAAETYAFQKLAENSDQLEERVKSLGDRVVSISNTLDRLMDSVLDPNRSKQPINEEPAPAALDQVIDSRIGRMEVNIETNTEMLNKIIELLQSGKGLSKTSISESTPPAITFLHHKARSSPYPQCTVRRADVPDDKVSWDVSFPEYTPTEYTAPVVLSKPPWADPDLMSMAIHARPTFKYNQVDEVYNVDRTSYTGVYKVEEGLALNPMGRTGMKGRGLLGRFGPNHAADPIVTRWKRTSAGVMLEGGKKVLEFVAILRKDNNQWAIPGGMVEPGQVVTQALKAEFGEEALAKMNVSGEERERIAKQIERLFQHGEEVYKGYVDDPRNTDNAWMETLAVNFHDDKGNMFNEFRLQAGDDAAAVRWQRVSGNIPLYASHVAILEKVAKMRDAAF